MEHVLKTASEGDPASVCVDLSTGILQLIAGHRIRVLTCSYYFLLQEMTYTCGLLSQGVVAAQGAEGCHSSKCYVCTL